MLLELASIWKGGFGKDAKTHIACLRFQSPVDKPTLYQMNCEHGCVLNHNIVLGEQFEM